MTGRGCVRKKVVLKGSEVFQSSTWQRVTGMSLTPSTPVVLSSLNATTFNSQGDEMTTWLGSTEPEEALLILQMGKGNPQSLKDEMKKVPCLCSELLLRHESMRGDLLGSEKGCRG